MNTWQKPELTTVCMNAEVGAYQEDFDGERPDTEARADEAGGASHAGGTSVRGRTARRAALEPANAIACSELVR